MNGKSADIGCFGKSLGTPGTGNCPRCHGVEFVDVVIHAGQSTRRDCATCHRTLGFPKWHGRDQQAQQERLQRILDRDKRITTAARLFDYQKPPELPTAARPNETS